MLERKCTVHALLATSRVLSSLKACLNFFTQLVALAQVVACLPLVQRVRGSIPSGVVNFHLKIFNLRARRGGDVHFSNCQIIDHRHGLNSKPFCNMYVEKAYSTVDSDLSVGWGCYAWWPPWCCSRASTGFHLLPSFHHLIQHNNTTQTVTHTVQSS